MMDLQVVEGWGGGGAFPPGHGQPSCAGDACLRPPGGSSQPGWVHARTDISSVTTAKKIHNKGMDKNVTALPLGQPFPR